MLSMNCSKEKFFRALHKPQPQWAWNKSHLKNQQGNIQTHAPRWFAKPLQSMIGFLEHSFSRSLVKIKIVIHHIAITPPSFQRTLE
jgi:hypothetical protein